MKWCIKNRHDNIVRYLVKHIKRKNRPNIVSLKAGTMPKNKIDKREPDITFVLDGMEYVIDVTFCKLKGAQQAAFDEKIRKYNVMGTNGKALYPRDCIIPIVINYRGTVF